MERERREAYLTRVTVGIIKAIESPARLLQTERKRGTFIRFYWGYDTLTYGEHGKALTLLYVPVPSDRGLTNRVRDWYVVRQMFCCHGSNSYEMRTGFWHITCTVVAFCA